MPGLARSTHGAGSLATTPLKSNQALWGLRLPPLVVCPRVSQEDGVSCLPKACCERPGEHQHHLAGLPWWTPPLPSAVIQFTLTASQTLDCTRGLGNSCVLLNPDNMSEISTVNRLIT